MQNHVTRTENGAASGWWWLNPWSYPVPRHVVNWAVGYGSEKARSKLLDLQAELSRHAAGDPRALDELVILLHAWYNTPKRFWNFRFSREGGGYCAAFLENLCGRLPGEFRDGSSALKVTPVWFKQGDPGLLAGAALCMGGAPGHFALRVEFPDGFVVYFDNGWAATGGVFTFMGGTKVPTPKRFLYDEIQTVPAVGEPGWPQ